MLKYVEEWVVCSESIFIWPQAPPQMVNSSIHKGGWSRDFEVNDNSWEQGVG